MSTNLQTKEEKNTYSAIISYALVALTFAIISISAETIWMPIPGMIFAIIAFSQIRKNSIPQKIFWSIIIGFAFGLSLSVFVNALLT